MSKYASLQKYLEQCAGAQLPMTFEEVERVLGFSLPPSARNHPAWWSNNRDTNVAVKAWRDAGWKTSRVDLGGERVTFVRHLEIAASDIPEALTLARKALSAGARKLIEEEAERHGIGHAEAAVILLNQTARRRLLDEIATWAKPSGVDSTAIIRAERDAR